MISTPNFRIHRSENENVTARKANLTESVTRKAFTDRKINQNIPKTNDLFSMKNKLGEIKMPKLKQEEPKYGEWLLDKCAFKEIEDTYEDIIPSKMRLNKEDVSSYIRAQTKTLDRDPQLRIENIHLPKIPEFKEIDMFVLDLPKVPEFNFNFAEEEDFPMPPVP